MKRYMECSPRLNGKATQRARKEVGALRDKLGDMFKTGHSQRNRIVIASLTASNGFEAAGTTLEDLQHMKGFLEQAIREVEEMEAGEQ